MKNLLLVTVILLAIYSCTSGSSQRSKNLNKSNYSLTELRKKKAQIDRLFAKSADSLIVFIKMTNKNELVRIYNGKFPDDSIEYTYNVLIDKGTVKKIIVSPYSESGDWDVVCSHYFNDDGRTFAFEKHANAFALPDDGVAYETTTDYFDPTYKRIKHYYKLVDKDEKALGKEYAFDYEGIDCKVYPSSNECLKAFHINLNK